MMNCWWCNTRALTKRGENFYCSNCDCHFSDLNFTPIMTKPVVPLMSQLKPLNSPSSATNRPKSIKILCNECTRNQSIIIHLLASTSFTPQELDKRYPLCGPCSLAVNGRLEYLYKKFPAFKTKVSFMPFITSLLFVCSRVCFSSFCLPFFFLHVWIQPFNLITCFNYIVAFCCLFTGSFLFHALLICMNFTTLKRTKERIERNFPTNVTEHLNLKATPKMLEPDGLQLEQLALSLTKPTQKSNVFSQRNVTFKPTRLSPASSDIDNLLSNLSINEEQPSMKIPYALIVFGLVLTLLVSRQFIYPLIA